MYQLVNAQKIDMNNNYMFIFQFSRVTEVMDSDLENSKM